ncbi:MAG: RDD family protein [Gammaproteobacteria bacterium]|nr:RDD family protein [Gammaproteobacteria bacterium]
MTTESTEINPPASLFKRLLAICYDLLLLTALLFTVGVIVASIFTFAINHGNAITEEHPAYTFYRVFILATLFITAYLFFGWFWIHGGQTLGMKTWRLRLQSTDTGTFNWKRAAIRYLGAVISWLVFGLGFIWILIDKNKRSWHDLMSKSVIVQLEKN